MIGSKFFIKSKFLIGIVCALFVVQIFSSTFIGQVMAQSSDSELFTVFPAFVEVSAASKDSSEVKITLRNTTRKGVNVTTRFRKYILKDKKLYPSELEVPEEDNPFTSDKNAFTLDAGKSETVTLNVDKSKIPNNGYYYWGLAFIISSSSEGDDKGVGLIADLVSIIALRGKDVKDEIAFYTTPGTPIFPFVLMLSPEQKFIVKNEGKTMFPYAGEVKLVRGKLEARGVTLDQELLNIDGAYLLPGESEDYDLKWENNRILPFLKRIGFYSVRANLKYSATLDKTLGINYEFFYIPLWLIILIIVLIILIVRHHIIKRKDTKKVKKNTAEYKDIKL